MKRAALGVSAVLLLGWIAFLAALALTQHDAIALSRPQLLAADLIVTAQVEEVDGPVRIEAVHHIAAGVRSPDEKQMIDVFNLRESRGGGAPGLYLLPLTADPSGKGYRVTPIPRSPGYYGGPPRVYAATAQTEASLKAILAGWAEP